ncbi:HD-GYP domain-containing protein [Thaumasiovibrio subtropicus]|uniref:HD-GYP domain-containing protein n=1 Tax=Thaumasiovibrio subtropicus TaxID=1891207 RepID=UPI000B34FC14|nr:HD-GYP domain-containing protein [Thaumasiovibrio subtropicus]
MIQEIAVDCLSEGLYVVEIENAKGRLRVSQPGRIRSLELVEKMKQSGVRRAWVDFDQSDLTSYVPNLQGKRERPKKTASLNVELKRAETILSESKDLLGKAIDGLYQGREIDIEPINALSESIVDSIGCNPDAIQCVAALREKDAYLLEHSLNVSFLMVSFGRYLGFDHSVLKQLAIGGVLHDVGKTKVNIEVLNKPARLTDEEFEHMKLHQVLSEPILDKIPGLSEMSRQVSLLHHEKLDGTGYPRGLKGDEISLVGRMSAIADIYDALTASRCYKEAMSPAAAFKILKSMAPHQIDGDLLNEFIRCVGVYPVGSLVALNDGRAGLVWESNEEKPLAPIVKCFYSVKHKHYIDVEIVDVAAMKDLRVEGGLSPGAENIDPSPYRK